MGRHYYKFSDLQVDDITFTIGQDRSGKATIHMHLQPSSQEVAMVSAPCITMWPRVSGDGNFGTMWGPADVSKAKFTLDLNDAPINGQPNTEFHKFQWVLDCIDNKLLDFVTNNQLRILGRKNLTQDEVRMLQIRSVRPKYDKHSGATVGQSMNLSTSKFAWDGMGGKYARVITVCDYQGKALPTGQVAPGDVVAATMFANQVYTGVGGDKFGIHWSFEDVSVVCQRACLEAKSEVSAFNGFDGVGKPYVDHMDQTSEAVSNYDASDQFGSPAFGT